MRDIVGYIYIKVECMCVCNIELWVEWYCEFCKSYLSLSVIVVILDSILFMEMYVWKYDEVGYYSLM